MRKRLFCFKDYIHLSSTLTISQCFLPWPNHESVMRARFSALLTQRQYVVMDADLSANISIGTTLTLVSLGLDLPGMRDGGVLVSWWFRSALEKSLVKAKEKHFPFASHCAFLVHRLKGTYLTKNPRNDHVNKRRSCKETPLNAHVEHIPDNKQTISSIEDNTKSVFLSINAERICRW